MASTNRFSLSNLDPPAAHSVRHAITIARDYNFSDVDEWVLLVALYMKDDVSLPTAPTVALSKNGLEIEKFLKAVQNRVNQKTTALMRAAEVPMSASVADMLTEAQKRAQKQSRLITVQDLWAEVLRNKNVSELLTEIGWSVANRNAVLSEWGVPQEAINDTGSLAKYCKDLTAAAAAGDLDPVVGRDDEIREAMNILQRRTKNNPIFVGEPGVGKTAMVEGLAQRMIKNEVPETLKNKVLVSLDVGALIAGAKYKGDLEERVKNLVKEIQDRDDVVLFIDEIHTLVNASGEASAVGQLLKPALARGELRCIGATTPDEYRYYLEKDPALERRFQKITVLEPSHEDAVAILRGVKDKYALHHGVDISDSALVAAVEWSARYIADRQLPDKAIDLMDSAAARVRTMLDSKPEQIDRIDRRVVQLKVQREMLKNEQIRGDLDEDTSSRLAKLERELQEVESQAVTLEQQWSAEKELHDSIQGLQEKLAEKRQDLAAAQRNQDLVAMSEIQYAQLPKLEQELRAARKQMRALADPMMHDEVTADQIAEVIARRTGIPVAKMKNGEQEKLADMESLLNKQVIGQPDAVEAVSDAVRRARSGLADPNKPIGSFLFLGPTGVGKTELTKVVSNFLFDRKDAMVRIDMSEFMEKHSVSRLIGAPPGYVGYEEGGVLTEAIRHHPYSVILLDEVEKAHQDVFNVLLQVLDDGHLTDGQGRTVDFKNTVIIMTSNLGASDIQDLTQQGASLEDIKETVMENVKKFFRPEFINRLDESVVFKPLDRAAIAQIAQLQLKRVVKRLEDRKISATITDAALDHLAEAGFDPLMGARPLKRAIQQELENPLAKEMVSGRLNSGDQLTVDCTGGKLTWVVRAAVAVEENTSESTADLPPIQINPAEVVQKTTARRSKGSSATKAKMA